MLCYKNFIVTMICGFKKINFRIENYSRLLISVNKNQKVLIKLKIAKQIKHLIGQINKIRHR